MNVGSFFYISPHILKSDSICFDPFLCRRYLQTTFVCLVALLQMKICAVSVLAAHSTAYCSDGNQTVKTVNQIAMCWSGEGM